jgi:KRAB domain-containing zinc finger protein
LRQHSFICSKSHVNNLNCIDVPAPQKQEQIVTDVKNVEKEYKCLECGKIISNYFNFYHHKKRHEGIIYRCVQCPSTYKSKSALKYHLRIEHELRKFECHHCQTIFKAKRTLKGHMSMHFNSELYPCNQCPARFFKHTALQYHSLICPKSNVKNVNCMDVKAPHKHAQVVTDVKNVEKEYKCLECGKIFSNYHTFYQHNKKIHEGIIHRCAQCPSTYKSINGLKFHLRTEHELRKFECHHCQNTFKAKFLLKRHMSLHFNSIVYPCNQCPARFFKHTALQYHSLICPKSNVNNLNCIDVPAPQKQAEVVTDVKNVEKEYKCLECGKIFLHYRYLYEHKKRHEGIIYRCVQCPSTYKSKNGLKLHLRTVHVLQAFECHHCQTTFRAISTLKVHMSLHFNFIEKEYKCLECGKIFSNYQKFYRHKKMHEERIYRCAQCPSTYQTISGLHCHLKTIHERRSFECHHCQTTFKAKDSLKRHMSTHSYSIEKDVNEGS